MSGSPFDPVHLAWKGQVHTIAPDRVMGAIKRIEDHVTLVELQAQARLGNLKLSRLASAFADVLRYAGAGDVSETEVYTELFGGKAEDVVTQAVFALLSLMIPRDAKFLGLAKAVPAPGKTPRRARRAAASSSRRRTS